MRGNLLLFCIDVGTKYSLEKSYAKDEQIKDVWEPEHHIITLKNCTVFTK